MTIEIRHEEDAQRFVATVEGKEAVVDYDPVDDDTIDDDTIDIHHTFVPPEARGLGLAGRLVTAALDTARARGWKVVATCPYVARFLLEHPEYQDLEASR